MCFPKSGVASSELLLRMSLWLVAILALHSGVAKTLSPSTPAVPGQNEQEASETGAEVGKLGELLPQDPGGDAQSNHEVLGF